MTKQLEKCRDLLNKLKEISDELKQFSNSGEILEENSLEYTIRLDFLDIWKELEYNILVLSKEEQFDFLAKRLKLQASSLLEEHNIFLEG